MELKFNDPNNELIVSLSNEDIQNIIAGHVVVEGIKRHLTNLKVNVGPALDKNFKEGLPIGDPFYIKKLRSELPSANVNGPDITIEIPRIILAANQSATEQIDRADITRTGSHPFNGSIKLRLEDAEDTVTSPPDEVV